MSSADSLQLSDAMEVLIVLVSALCLASASPSLKGLRATPTVNPNDPDFELQFPETFFFSTATASYQVEGAWNVSGKGENIWDRTTHEHPELVLDRSNGDIACDSYNKYKEDIQLAKDLGTNMYRFSLSWSRLLPTGAIDQVNPDGVRYYKALLTECEHNKIEPMVTIFHWDLPQPLQDIGGLPSEAVVDYMVDYFDFAFRTFGDQVKYWITLNEPYSMCNEAYGNGGKAPAIHAEGRGDYLCAHNVLKAHGRAYRLYQEKYKEQQNGKIGMSSYSDFFYPKDPKKQEDVDAAERWHQFQLGWFAHPVYSKDGDYPPVMREYVDAASKKQGLERSRLPKFTPEEVEMIKGSADFFGLNYYRSQLVAAVTPSDVQPVTGSKLGDAGVVVSFDPTWTKTIADWLVVVPDGFGQLFRWVAKEYDYKEIIVTENGYPDGGELIDDGRVNYYRYHILEVLKAIHKDNIKVVGYTAWSLLDNYEWFFGYAHKFGLHRVDFNDPKRTRTPKKSAAFYKKLIATRKIPKDSDINYTTPSPPTQPTEPSTASTASGSSSGSSPTTSAITSTTPSSSPALRAWPLVAAGLSALVALLC